MNGVLTEPVGTSAGNTDPLLAAVAVMALHHQSRDEQSPRLL